MELKRSITTGHAKLESIQFVPTEKDPKAVLLVSFPLIGDHSSALGCPYVFDRTGIPQDGLTDVALDLTVRDAHIKLSEASYKPDLIHKFKVYIDGDKGLHCQTRIHMNGHFHDLVDFLTNVNKSEFDLVIEPSQAELPLE